MGRRLFFATKKAKPKAKAQPKPRAPKVTLRDEIAAIAVLKKIVDRIEGRRKKK